MQERIETENRLRIYADRTCGKVKNYWSNVHFHPTDAIEDEWGQRILNQIAEDNAAQTIRMYAMLEDIVTLDEQGNLCYDFALNDERLDYLLSKGFKIVLCYNFIPPCLATDPEEVSSQSKNKTRYKGKMIVTSPPKSYEVWEEVCAAYTAHIVERYGEDTVANWYLQCHNEPDLVHYWMKNEENDEVRCKEYVKLYDAFEAGIRRVSTKLKIGGPVLARKLNFLEMFLEHIRDKGRQMDFISFHAYGTNWKRLKAGTKPFAVDNSLEYICSVKEIAERYGFGNTPLVIDEWGACTAGFCNVEECPPLIFREKPAFAAYFAKMITLYVEKKLPIELLMICLSGQHEMTRDFTGFRNLFTLHFYRKPIYNAYCLAGKLGEKLLAWEGDADKNLSVLPTMTEDGSVVVMLGYASEHFDEVLPPIEIELAIQGGEGAYTGEVYRIDETHANAMHTYESLSCPDNPTEEQMEIIRKSAVPVAEPFVATEESPLRITLENESMVVIRWKSDKRETRYENRNFK